MATEQQTSLTALANNSTDHSPCDWQQKDSRPEARTRFVADSMHQRWDVISIHRSTKNIGPQRDISPNANTNCNPPWAVYHSGLTLAPKRCNVHACLDRVKPVCNACPLAQLRLAGHPHTPLLQCPHKAQPRTPTLDIVVVARPRLTAWPAPALCAIPAIARGTSGQELLLKGVPSIVPSMLPMTASFEDAFT